MASSDVLTAIRELSNAKQLERADLLDLLRDGINAALVKRYGPGVRSEIDIDEMKGTIRVQVLRTVVEQVEDPSSQISLEEARWEDPDFQPGDVRLPLDKIFHASRLKVGTPCVLIVHRDDYFSAQLAVNLGGGGGVDREIAAHRRHQNIHLTYFGNLLIAQGVAEVAEVADFDAIDFKTKESHIAPLAAVLGIVKGWNRFKLYPLYLFSLFDHDRIIFDDGHVAMVAVRMADGDDVSRFVKLPIRYPLVGSIWVDNYFDAFIRCNQEGGVSQPFDFHNAEALPIS